MRIIVSMSDDRKTKPMDDVSEGLGLLFRAAKTVTQSTVDRLEKLPSDNLENFVTEGVKEVGRVLETVGTAIEREVMGTKADAKPKADGDGDGSKGAPQAAAAAPEADKGAVPQAAANPPAADEPPKGPRIV